MIQKVWVFLSSNLPNIFSIVGLLTVLCALIALITRLTVGNFFNKNLERHKSQLMIENDQFKKHLNSELEELKHKQQKILKDFDLYTTKKHETYPELYKCLEKAIGKIMRLKGETRFPSFENVSSEDLEDYLKSLNVTAKDKDDILQLWNNNATKNDAILRIRKVLKMISYNEAYELWHEANDFFIYNELYFSERVAGQARKLLDFLWEYLEYLEPIAPLDSEDLRAINELKTMVIPNARNELKQLLKEDLTLSFNQ
ncbi:MULTISPECIES: hypothetical protein [unclassified Paenibacillus]|uniref:hypothetical protein n=1 Tax=unclassified Paenibacillus TaxID=185978 RepID=UPI001AE1BEB6|nr:MULTISPECIES: hypothetical protein [unclassified Paenibacillus]MBP1153967.1 hypothetical protein [Paenibacillus sp. PvP091]MBP1170648.1 hypothetical protein [Paenibacillus sp. PvR098]MBP2441676.1 hypothetical protein [Paenibacillus sp. PvP052]